MIFKSNWEKADQNVQIDPETIYAMIEQACPGQLLISYNVISGGCANLNIQVHISEEPNPLILRIYLRDQDAAYREQKLAALIKEEIPIPAMFFVGDCKGYRFAVTECRQGILLRDLLLNNDCEISRNVMVEAGLTLGIIHKYHFLASGFFDADLSISIPIAQNDYVTCALELLEHPLTRVKINKNTIAKLKVYVEKSASLFPDGTTRNLVHGDFGPENILVKQCDGQWKLSAILDWEFAFSGSELTDVANMLRYSHQMSPIFEKAFLQGLHEGGIELPNNWRTRIALLNLLALLDCLIRSSSEEQSNRCADICDLIAHITQQLDQLD